MGKSIVIIHSSEIVRKGLLAIFENRFQANIICFSGIDDCKNSHILLSNDAAILLEEKNFKVADLMSIRKKVLNYFLIGINEKNEKKSSDIFEFHFSIYNPPDTLLEWIKNYFSLEITDDNSDELTIREKEVLRLIAMGHTNKTIAEKLFISTHTVISHRKKITEKLGIKSIPGLTVYAIIQNIVSASEITPDQLI